MVPTARVSVYREKASGRYKVQPCGLDDTTGSQPQCGSAIVIPSDASGDELAKAILDALPTSMQPIGTRRVVLQSAEDRRRWIKDHDAVLVEMPEDGVLRVVPLRLEGRSYAGGRSVNVSMAKGQADISALTKALRIAFKRAAS